MEKEILRADIKAQRKQLTKEEITERSTRAFSVLFSSGILKNAKTIMVYISAFNEIRTDAIIDKLLSLNIRVCAPVTDTENVSITPYYIDKEKQLSRGAYGIYEPSHDMVANPGDIDAIIVPGIAFDKKGNRMGFGAGYYDRFLESFDGIKIGLCYNFQLLDTIPSDEHDIPMDYIISEDKIYVI